LHGVNRFMLVVFVQDNDPCAAVDCGYEQQRRKGKIMRANEIAKRIHHPIFTAIALLLVLALLAACTLQIDESALQRGNEMNTTTATQSGYAEVNGLDMYYEMHGTGGTPLVLLHGAFSATGTSFGKFIPTLAESRQVVSFEQQGHGHTADIDRPLTIEQMAEDTAAALQAIGIEKADIFGYSMGAGIALQLAIHHPELVNKVVVASVAYNTESLHPGMIEGMEFLAPEMLVGSPWHEEYMRLAPNPEDFDTLVTKIKELNLHHLPSLTAEEVQQISAPTLIIVGDSDIVRPEGAVEMFRLLGGGVNGDIAGLPNAQLAVLPGTSHTMVVERGDWLVPMITAFLDAPMPVEE
jgi:pimeloyl-ACP methyl ester carboxylesterase